MRIIGYIDTKGYKTTVFKNNDRFIVKFESDLFEQTFKFRESEKVGSFNDIKNLIDAEFQKQVEDRFKEMYESSGRLLDKYLDCHEDEWEEII
ncbi:MULTISPECIES: hypothetical protein [unclassified Aureispira]|uniref:hypothetical protein n=1 Tax=unclassified Aureispira TaxID=2649989 RepID=UPI0006983BDC|nr:MULTISPECIES: hypothetical protein [unclassified Aureispira]WMX16385.1 hypothetical protein QP953_08400 [Aureispira sp. CCB-E]